MIALKVEDQTVTETQMDLKETTVEYIESLVSDNYSDDDIYQFINEYGEDDFVNFYEEYVRYGEDYSYDAVDIFIEEFGIENISSFEDSYRGCYESKGAFTESFVNDCYCVDIPAFLVIDWEESFDSLDFIYNNGFVFDRNF
jgi:hypothetical protein